MLKIAWATNYCHPLPPGHRFPMAKYEVLPEQLLYEGTVTEANFFTPAPAAEPLIVATHTAQWWHKLQTLSLSPSEERRTGFPLSAGLVAREVTILQGTVRAADFARQFGLAMNIAGGTHHAFTDRGEGFCLLNDVAVAARYLLDHHGLTKILIVDLDVHQGNGTAQIFANEPRVFTFSMHGHHNYPLHKEQSDLDVPLPTGTDDTAYLALLRHHLPRLMDQVQPQFVFFIAGVDVLATDKLGKLALTRAGCRTRDREVLATCRRHGVPVVVSMGGGYSPRLADIVEAHANTFRLGQELFF
ncbi:MAG: histone deacetylase [Bernardetiaceae bacterium]|jgi:acetoin utilization deacetylase AcuC-like enzyme|nr:histone deacetylase [Bernardetiaceae bacterium]